MRHRWPEDIRFTRVVLEVEDNVCGVCGGTLHICDHRRHRIFTGSSPSLRPSAKARHTKLRCAFACCVHFVDRMPSAGSA